MKKNLVGKRSVRNLQMTKEKTIGINMIKFGTSLRKSRSRDLKILSRHKMLQIMLLTKGKSKMAIQVALL